MAQGCRYKKCAFEGFEAIELSNGLIRLVTIPELGGKIASIIDGYSGREWLWKNPYLKYRSPVYGASYIQEFDFGGIDECFPTVGPVAYPSEPWQGTIVPDHGEIWALPWSVEGSDVSEEHIAITMQCYGVRFPYRFERKLIIEKGLASVILEYHVTNLSPFPFQFIWSIHPLMQVEPGMRLFLPNCVSKVRIDLSTNDWLGRVGRLVDWPTASLPDGSSVDLSFIQPPALQQGVKYFTLPLEGKESLRASLMDLTGRKFTFCFHPREISHIGIWMNCAGWTPLNQSPYYNLAFEPCIGGSDSLTVAIGLPNGYATLDPHGEYRWALQILLD
jgi:hypothetical protein